MGFWPWRASLLIVYWLILERCFGGVSLNFDECCTVNFSNMNWRFSHKSGSWINKEKMINVSRISFRTVRDGKNKVVKLLFNSHHGILWLCQFQKVFFCFERKTFLACYFSNKSWSNKQLLGKDKGKELSLSESQIQRKRLEQLLLGFSESPHYLNCFNTPRQSCFTIVLLSIRVALVSEPFPQAGPAPSRCRAFLQQNQSPIGQDPFHM